MAWLVKDGEVLAGLEIAESRRAKRRGLLGRDGIEGALLLEPGRSVHTFGMRFPIDAVFCDRDGRVVAIRTLPKGRITWPVWSARSIIEAEAGSAERWGLAMGDGLEWTT
ncbi:MAG TPA: DUF192 domain-containing protein [Acidimicrobiales bacterium]|nr:DUF192 domain-containing protein [Acidimicrobiales bacterium]